MNRVIGILAHVDAGKTTLAEALLYRSGALRSLGRVDNKNTIMDTHELERERGITIFSGEAGFSVGEARFTLMDTPGHVDFSAETERVLSVLDMAVLVISGTDGVQAHTRTLWKLLSFYNIPTAIFVTKMDFARREKEDIMTELGAELSDYCFDYFSDSLCENLSLCREDVLEKYLESGEISETEISELFGARLFFPCFFGSGLRLTGIDEFLEVLPKLLPQRQFPSEFGAKVYKITHDGKGECLSHMRITGGRLCVRDDIGGQKINGLRVYSGGRFERVESAEAGDVVAVPGLQDSFAGQGLGFEKSVGGQPVLTPVMSYKIILPGGADAQTALASFKVLEQEDPQLKFSWNSYLQQISVSLMGKVQTEILKSIVSERFSLDIEIGEGSVLYKETILEKSEGVGHFEPLRHYAEVHLILEPLPRGSGVKFDSCVSTDTLAVNWQRLIMMHLSEKEHLGVLTGSPITDMKITLAAGRAHLKHTEGGDFRQATYRAVRQGLMRAKTQLLEPYYRFRIELPTEHIGRAINDVRMRCGEFDSPEDIGGMYLLCGRVPAASFNDYAAELSAYTGGRGRISLTQDGYDICHNPDEVIEKIGYNADADTDNSADSVFCAHGAGFNVKWDKVEEYMHIESCLPKEPTAPIQPALRRRNMNIDDKELEAIMLREFGPIRRREYKMAKVVTKTHEQVRAERERKKLLIVDGYNVIFAWEDLNELAKSEIANARDKLCDILANYSAFTGIETVVVFDAYKVSGGEGSRFDRNGVHIVYTEENQTADAYIEKMIGDIGKNHNVSVVTSDGLIQVSAIRAGVLRVPASQFEAEVDKVYAKITEAINNNKG